MAMISREFIKWILPEFDWIENPELREACVSTWMETAKKAHHTKASLLKVLFADTGLENCPVTLIEHTRLVTKTAVELAKQFNAAYAPQVKADMDLVTAGALLHDVGKAYESFAEDPDGALADETAYVRHPFLGAAIARDCGCPWQVSYIINNHSFEGDDSRSFPEMFLVRRADTMHFEYLFYGYERRRIFKNG